MEKVAIGAILAECMTLIIKKIKGMVRGNTHTSYVTPPSNRRDKPNKQEEEYCSPHNRQKTNVDKFNLLNIRDLFTEFKVDINRGVAFRVLLDTIKAQSYSNLVNDFYYNATDVATLLYKWDKTCCRQYLVCSTLMNDGVYVLQEDIDLYIRNCKIFVQPDISLEQKVQLLLNHNFKEGHNKFVKRYESRISILKADKSCNEAFDSIRAEMKSYLDFV